jgi:hypothetical protein
VFCSLSNVWLCLKGSWRLWFSLALVFICLGFMGSIVFAIKKACVLVAALLSLELGVYYPYGMV